MIGNNIKKLREINNLTQEDLAKECGVTYQAVSKWENNRCIPKVNIIKKLSKIFNVNINAIIN